MSSLSPFIVHPQLKEVARILDEIRHAAKRVDGVVQNIMIVGETGSGKSRFAQEYASRTPAYCEKGFTRVPVIHHTVQAATTPKMLLQGLLVSIGDPQQGKGANNERDLRDRFYRLMQTIQAELLIIDEAQAYIQDCSERVLLKRVDVFKDIINTLRIPVVLMGTPWASRILEASEQLARRVAYRRVLRPFGLETVDARRNYFHLLRLLAEAHHMDLPLDMKKDDFGYRAFAFSSGSIGRTVELFRDVAFRADEGSKTVCQEDFAAELRERGCPPELNPFLIPEIELQLLQREQLTAYHHHGPSNRLAEDRGRSKAFRIRRKGEGIRLVELKG